MEISGLSVDESDLATVLQNAKTARKIGEMEFERALSNLRQGNINAAVDWAEQGINTLAREHGRYPRSF